MRRIGGTGRRSELRLALACALIATMLLGACAASQERAHSRKAPVGAFLTTGATPTDPERVDPRVRRWGVIGVMEQLAGRPIKVMELSGGGQYGAFGAGFLNGWTQSGTRPQFDLVTGISTGALLATHAFLDTPADEAVLKEIYTGINRPDIYRGNLIAGLFGGAALNRTDPMAALIENTITPEVLERVADQWSNTRVRSRRDAPRLRHRRTLGPQRRSLGAPAASQRPARPLGHQILRSLGAHTALSGAATSFPNTIEESNHAQSVS